MGEFMTGLTDAVRPAIDQRLANEQKLKEQQAQVYWDAIKSGNLSQDQINYSLQQLQKLYGHKSIKDILNRMGSTLGGIMGKQQQTAPQGGQPAAPTTPGAPPQAGPPQSRAATPPFLPPDQAAAAGARQALPPPGGGASPQSASSPAPNPAPSSGGSSSNPAQPSPAAAGSVAGGVLPPPQKPSQGAPSREEGLASILTSEQRGAEARKTRDEQFKTDEEIRKNNADTSYRAQAERQLRSDEFDDKMLRVRTVLQDKSLSGVDKQAMLAALGVTANALGQPREIKGIPGSKLPKDAKDAFGNPIDPALYYTQTESGAFYPEKPPVEKQQNDEYDTRVRLNQVLSDPKSTPQQKEAARATLKHLDATERGLEVRINNSQAGTKQSVSDDALRALAEQEKITDKRPAFGLGAKDPDRKRYLQIYAETLQNDPDYLQAKASYKAGQASIAQLQKVGDFLTAKDSAFNADMDNAREASEKVARTNAKILNGGIQAIEAALTDHPELQQLYDYTQTVINSYAAIASGAGTRSTDAARREATDLLNAGFSKNTFAASLDALKREADNTIKGFEKQQALRKKSLNSLLPGSKGTNGTSGPTGSSGTGEKPKNASDYLKSIGH
jgi:hypothetical protein